MLTCRAGAMRRRVFAFVLMSILTVRFERTGTVHFQGKITVSISKGKARLQSAKSSTGAALYERRRYEITPTADGCNVALTEKSEIKNPIFRLMVRIFGPTKYIDEHLVDLAKHFGETGTVR